MKFHTSIVNTLAIAIFVGLPAQIASSLAQSGPGNYGNVNRVYSCSRDGDTINLRSRAGEQNRILAKIPSGKPVVLVGKTIVIGDFTWQKVNFYGVIGWVRGDFLCS